jgi:hypothetical protein
MYRGRKIVAIFSYLADRSLFSFLSLTPRLVSVVHVRLIEATLRKSIGGIGITCGDLIER